MNGCFGAVMRSGSFQTAFTWAISDRIATSYVQTEARGVPPPSRRHQGLGKRARRVRGTESFFLRESCERATEAAIQGEARRS